MVADRVATFSHHRWYHWANLDHFSRRQSSPSTFNSTFALTIRGIQTRGLFPTMQ
jgi:hypothetical protein